LSAVNDWLRIKRLCDFDSRIPAIVPVIFFADQQQ